MTHQTDDLTALETLAKASKERADAASEGPWTTDSGMAGGRARHLCIPERGWHSTASIAHFCYQGPKLNNPNRIADILAQEQSDLSFCAAARSDVPALSAAVLDLIARVLRCEEALKPFAEVGATISERYPDFMNLHGFDRIHTTLTVGDLRRAAALPAAPAAKEEEG